MKNPTLIIGIIIILLLLAGAYYYVRNNPVIGLNKKETRMYQQNPGIQSKVMSLSEILSLGKDQTCSFDTKGDYGSTKGISYISGTKVRTDYSNTDPQGKTITGSMVMDGNTLYTWNSASNQGFKMAVSQDMKDTIDEAKKDPQKYQQAIDPNAQMDYKCDAWTVDANQFVPPSNIEFVDYSAQMKQMEELKKQMPQNNTGSSDMKAQQCAACDSAPSESQAACKEALGCN